MTRTTALLLLAAVLLIVANLVGKDGTVANISAMDEGQLAANISEQSKSSADVPFRNPLHGDATDPAAIVDPVVIDDPEEAIEAEPFDESLSAESDLNGPISADSGEVPFDPRVG